MTENEKKIIIDNSISNTQQSTYILHKKYNLHTRKITLLLEKSKKPEKSKNDTKQKVTTNETLLTTKTVQYAQKKYV